MLSAPAPEVSSWANCLSRVAPLVASSSSFAASVLASSSSTFFDILSKVSKALLLPEIEDMVLLILSWASARLDLAMSMFFLREAFVDLVLELPEGDLELLDRLLLGLPLGLELAGVALVLLLADEGLLGEVVPVGADGEHGLLLPVLGQALVLGGLALELLLVGDGHGDGFLGFDHLLVHVEDELIEHLLGILGLADEVVDI